MFAQNDSITLSKEMKVVEEKATLQTEAYDPLAPSRAAFYSAVLPGLGQAYNKKYWKIPVIYAGIASGVYFYIQNKTDYNRFRDAYKRRLAGFTDDEFYGTGTTAAISNNRLIDAQRSTQRNKDVSIIVSIGFYLFNIIDANVDAHLRQYDISDDLSITPKLNTTNIAQPSYGLSFRYIIR
ncbi:MAG: hypothetical protein ACJAYD_000640 [Patiriisocius sp.]